MTRFRPAAVVTLFWLLGGCDGTSTPAPVPLLSGPPKGFPLAEGAVALVGDGVSSCSHEPPEGTKPRNERWCAFARSKGKGNPAELWVVNVDQAARGPAPCDGSSPHCLRLSESLWTGDPVFSPAHPYVHGFFGDTLIFYADSTKGHGDTAFEGVIQAWRPGMKAGRALSGIRGYYCFGHERTAVAVCLTNQGRGTGNALEFDLLGGAVEGGPVGPLPLLERVRPYDTDGSLAWGVSFSPDGKLFVLSTKTGATPSGQAIQAMRIVPVAELGITAPHEILADVNSWTIAPDGRHVIFMRDLVKDEFGAGGGTLTKADFPTGANPTPLAAGVSQYELYGEAPHTLKGIGLYETKDDISTFRLMRDIAKPSELVTVAREIETVLVSPDLRHSFFVSSDDNGEPLSQVARNDGSGKCKLNRHAGGTAFSVRFVPERNWIIWAEDASDGVNIGYEGYYANPDDCQGGQRFSTKLGYYQVTRGGLLVGDMDNSFTSMNLRYAPFKDGELKPSEALPIAPSAGVTVALVDKTYAVYTVNQAAGMSPGLYGFGPLP